MSFLINLALGLLFGVGLVVSGMSDPAKVLNFLDLAGTWDPSLAFVMGGAVLVAFVGYHAAAGTEGVVSHTFLGSQLTGVTLNGRLMSEGYLNALLAAEYGARLGVVSGDNLTCDDAAGYAR